MNSFNHATHARARSSAWLEHQSYNPKPFLFPEKENSTVYPKEKGLLRKREEIALIPFLFWGNLRLFSLGKEKRGRKLVVEGSNPSVPKLPSQFKSGHAALLENLKGFFE